MTPTLTRWYLNDRKWRGKCNLPVLHCKLSIGWSQKLLVRECAKRCSANTVCNVFSILLIIHMLYLCLLSPVIFFSSPFELKALGIMI